jgi:hypothetical protein
LFLGQLPVFGQVNPPPGRFLADWPQGFLGDGAGDLTYPAGDGTYFLLRTREDLLVERSLSHDWVSVKPAGIRPAGLLTDSARSEAVGLIFGIHGNQPSRSLNFGASWEKVKYLGSHWQQEDHQRIQLVVDPLDGNHFDFPRLAFETRDCGQTFTWLPNALKGTAAFDAITPGRLLISGFEMRGLSERRDAAPTSP